MIGPKRALHFRIWCGIAGVIPLILAAAWLARTPDLPGTSDGGVPVEIRTGTLVEEHGALDGKLTLSLLATGSGPVLQVTRHDALKNPDVLIYWESEASGKQLVGPLGSAPFQQFDLPDAGPFTVILYSLGHQATVATIAFPGGQAR